MIIEGQIKGIKNSKKSLLLIDTPGINNSLDLNHAQITRDVCHPRTFSEYVKCFGLKHSTGVWEDNAEILLRERNVPFADLLAHREDVYEYLLKHGIEKDTAFEIAEYVRKGKANRRGWTPEMLEALDEAGIPDWFRGSCEKIRYLFTRAHAMTLYRNYCKEIM